MTGDCLWFDREIVLVGQFGQNSLLVQNLLVNFERFFKKCHSCLSLLFRATLCNSRAQVIAGIPNRNGYKWWFSEWLS